MFATPKTLLRLPVQDDCAKKKDTIHTAGCVNCGGAYFPACTEALTVVRPPGLTRRTTGTVVQLDTIDVLCAGPVHTLRHAEVHHRWDGRAVVPVSCGGIVEESALSSRTAAARQS